MASGDKSMGKVSVWRQEEPTVWPGLHLLTQLVLKKEVILSPQGGRSFGDFNLLK